MQEQAVTAADTIQMLGIGRADFGSAILITEVPDEREFLLSQLSPHDRASVEKALARHPEWTVGHCIVLNPQMCATDLDGLDGTMARRLRSQRIRMTSRFRRAVRFSGERPAERQALTGASSSVV